MSNPNIEVPAAASLEDLLGKVDNLHDPVPILNRRPVAYGLVLFLLVVSAVSAGFRLYVRFRVTRCPGWDDLFIGLSLCAGILLSAAIFVGFNYHFGEHFLTFGLDLTEMSKYSKAAYFANAMYPTATALVKVAILLQFLRLFEAKSRYRTATLIMLYITSLWGLAFSVISWFPAFPVSAFWDLTNQNAIRYGVASLKVDEFTGTLTALNTTNMVLDVVILGIPVPYYMKSNLSWKTRLSLLGLFVLGSVINGISLARLASVVITRAGTYPTLDPSFYGTTQLVLTSLEVSLAITAASLPVFWPLMRFGWGDIFVTTVITVQHQDEKDVPNAPKPYANPWAWDTEAGPWKPEIKDMPLAKTRSVETFEEPEPLVVKPMPDFKTWIATKDVEDPLVITPLPDFKTWKMAKEHRRSSSLYTNTIC